MNIGFTISITTVFIVILLVASSAIAQKPEVNILEVSVDFDSQIFSITGENFNIGPNPTTVSLGGYGNLNILSNTGNTVVVDFPGGGIPPGNYTLFVSSGPGQKKNDLENITIGSQGPQGDMGDQGPQGNTGAQGPQGSQGVTGPQGPQGPAGNDGAQGPKGDPGPQGSQGDPGLPGKDGATGPQGPAGPGGVLGYNIATISKTLSIPGRTIVHGSASCLPGKVVLGGGCDIQSVSRNVRMRSLRPDNSTGFYCEILNASSGNTNATLSIWAICADAQQ